MLSKSDFIMPFFVTHGRRIRRPIASMPGQYQLSLDQLMVEAGKCMRNKINKVILFGIPRKKDPLGKEAYAVDGIVQQAIRQLKKKFPRLVVMADLCFCEYTSHGHCGVLKNRAIDRKATLKLIRETAVSQARAGANVVAPSGMTRGDVKVIRDEFRKQKIRNVKILSYSAKFASAFYGPFREAAGSAPQFGDRRAYQLDPGNDRAALKKLKNDHAAGADMIMVKPALSYLDILARIKPKLKVPLVAYNVSGEYAMLKAAGQKKWLDEKKVVLEILTSMKRAGADYIITYHALELAKVVA